MPTQKHQKSIDQRVIDIINDQMVIGKHSDVTPQTKIDDLGGDSLDIIEIVMLLEEEFGVIITDEETDKLESVEDFIECIQSKVN